MNDSSETPQPQQPPQQQPWPQQPPQQAWMQQQPWPQQPWPQQQPQQQPQQPLPQAQPYPQLQPLPQPLPQPPAYTQPNAFMAPKPAAILPKSTAAEAVLALLILLGSLFLWHFMGPEIFGGQGIGVTLFFLYSIAVAFLYLQLKGVKHDLRSWLIFVAAVVGSIHFALYGSRSISFIFVSFEVVLCLLWVMYACRNQIMAKLNLSIALDTFTQLFITPFRNFGCFFTQGFGGLATKKAAWRYIAFTILGMVVSIPIFIIVISLLASADEGFAKLVSGLTTWLENVSVFRYTMEIICAVPFAAYLFGAIYGNYVKRQARVFDEHNLQASFDLAHVIPRAVVYAPLFLLLALYVVFFIAVGSYLFSGLAGQLPVVYTYAEYARRGFFELCAVATINLIVLGGIWWLVKREAKQYPLAMRLLAAALAALTCLLIITALSKMFIYIDAYGLTELRFYTSIFMIFLLVSFCLILAWHIKAFNAAQPIIVMSIVVMLSVGLLNTNSLIAEHNVDRYLNGETSKIDIYQLDSLGDAATPALIKLAENGSDAEVTNQAIDLLDANHLPIDSSSSYDYSYLESDEYKKTKWVNADLAEWQAQQLYDSKIREIRLGALNAKP